MRQRRTLLPGGSVEKRGRLLGWSPARHDEVGGVLVAVT